MRAAAAAAERLNALTGLRFCAAAAVFTAHLKGFLRMDHWNPGNLGNAAVGFFFVLSGFILSHVYRRGSKPVLKERFYLARFARLWPVHLACLALMLPLTGASAAASTSGFWSTLLAHVLLLQSWTTDLAWAQALNGPAWSLSVEVFFYALFPVLARLSTRKILGIYLTLWSCNIGLYAIADGLTSADGPPPLGLYVLATTSPPARLPEFLLGILTHSVWSLRDAQRQSSRGVLWWTGMETLAFAFVIASYCSFCGSDLGPAWIDAPSRSATMTALAHGPGLSFAFAALIYACACGRGLLSWLMASPPLRYLGEISYSFYLSHTWTLMATTQHMGIPALSWGQHTLYSTLVALAVASLLHATIETPVRQALVAPTTSWLGRARALTSELRKTWRSPLFLLTTATGGIALAAVSCNPPTLPEMASTIATHGRQDLRDIGFGQDYTLLGAMTGSDFPRFKAWVAIRENTRLACRPALEARTTAGALVHTFECDTQRLRDSAGIGWVVVSADADYSQIAGSNLLTLTIQAADGTARAPITGPITPDGASLELLRLPH
jgi:peptidoglycan/LPS O-acetylase OafA/YrhL